MAEIHPDQYHYGDMPNSGQFERIVRVYVTKGYEADVFLAFGYIIR